MPAGVAKPDPDFATILDQPLTPRAPPPPRALRFPMDGLALAPPVAYDLSYKSQDRHARGVDHVSH